MQAQKANKQTSFADADHRKHGNGLTAVALHQMQSCCGQFMGVDCDRIWSGDVGCSDLCPLVGSMVLQGAAQVAVGDQAGQARGGIGRLNPARPKAAPAGTALGEMAYHYGQGCFGRERREFMGWHHQIGHGEGELAAEGAGWVVGGELLW